MVTAYFKGLQEMYLRNTVQFSSAEVWFSNHFIKRYTIIIMLYNREHRSPKRYVTPELTNFNSFSAAVSQVFVFGYSIHKIVAGGLKRLVYA